MLPENRQLNFNLRRGGRQYPRGFRSSLLLGLLHSSTQHTTKQRAQMQNLFGNAEGKQDHRENKQTESKESITTVPLLWGGF